MIHDYADLITEAAHRTGVTDVASRAGMYVGMAEAALANRLRVTGNEVEIPSLEANDTNWLLEKDPELYLQAVIFQTYTASKDVEKAQVTAGYLGSLIEEFVRADRVARFSRVKITTPRAPA